MRRHAIPSAATPTLDLYPDEVDIELPLDEASEVDPNLDVAEALRSTLRDALAVVLDSLEHGTPIPSNRLRSYRVLAGRPAVVDDLGTPDARRDEGTARAAAKWTPEEEAAVDTAIATIAKRRAQAAEDLRLRLGASGRATNTAGLFPEEFTTAEVWAELGVDFPVTKGITGRMRVAQSAGLIANTGRTVIAPRDATGPNHGQRLTVWRAQ